MQVTKRDGSREPLDLNKFHKVVETACEGITGVSVSEIEIKSNIQFYDKIKTNDIQETLIKSAAELISEETPNYQYVASRLINFHLRKLVYGTTEIPHILDHVNMVVSEGYYDAELLNEYDKDEWNKIQSMINHDRDYSIVYVGMEQLRGKYLVKNRVTKKYYETPQIAYILIAATLFSKYPKETRLKYVKEFYDAISNNYISLPTPIMAGVRTPQRQFSSCVLIDTADNLDSINASTSAIVKYVSQKAGIGLNIGAIRAIGSPIRKGDAYHTGIVPFIKMFQSAVKSCSQGGVRSGAATLNYPCWHLEFEDLIVLKNNKGIEDTRARHVDYSVHFNKLMYERLLSGGNITLFSPSDVPGLYDAFYSDQETFKDLYEKAEKNSRIRKKTMKAIDLFSSFVQERKDTGRIYLMNVDNANTHSAFNTETSPIKMTNLCSEINLPVSPMTNVSGSDGEIAICTLSAINWGKIKDPSEFEKYCDLAVRALDELLDYQGYPVAAAEKAKKRRSLGIGIINLAYWLAKNDLTYQDISKEGLQKIHEWTEAWSYYLIKASVELAKEKGACEYSSETKYSKGIMPIDTYKRDVDGMVDPIFNMDWDMLRKDAIKYGIRNSTLMALMPAETSASVSNATNGIEPPRSLVSVKQSKDGVLKQVVPEIKKLKNKYDLLWNQKSPEGYLKICSVLQVFIDQSISVNTSYNPKFYPDEKIPMSDMIKHLLMFYKYGGKNLYYFNTYDGASDGTEIKADDDCESCKI